jgi:hypothetical protein
VKTEERLAVPWDEGSLVAQIKALLPEGQAVYLRDHGVAELPLHGFNSILARHGLIMHATMGTDPRRAVICRDEYGRVERYERFELRQLMKKAPRRKEA